MTDAPAHGARFELVHEEAGRYRVEVRSADAALDARVDLGVSPPSIAWRAPPPPWIAETVLGLCRTLQKNHQDDASWPARLHRWRHPR